ncbi:PREDICTED: gonadal protein gdl isoform X2 [Dinoponera quadriceps]|uniref:Gonadal protein gdl isoform X2 n=1 Tax=Dinoponera quadriceps TaxID=609295 RepID=A0A6P3XIB5_DINQU|nr:PREDICTED: gonadal protein gdl isoform X2 [Dinoponera quadriceps]
MRICEGESFHKVQRIFSRQLSTHLLKERKWTLPVLLLRIYRGNCIFWWSSYNTWPVNFHQSIKCVCHTNCYPQRLQLLNQQKIESQEALSTITTDEEIMTVKAALYKKHKEELRQTDMKLVLQLDQKVSDQQSILEKAGVPGFYVTNNPMEIQVQMRLCDFIIRLSKMDVPS